MTACSPALVVHPPAAVEARLQAPIHMAAVLEVGINSPLILERMRWMEMPEMGYSLHQWDRGRSTRTGNGDDRWGTFVHANLSIRVCRPHLAFRRHGPGTATASSGFPPRDGELTAPPFIGTSALRVSPIRLPRSGTGCTSRWSQSCRALPCGQRGPGCWRTCKESSWVAPRPNPRRSR